jgi:methionyl-tRNA formyltransferase
MGTPAFALPTLAALAEAGHEIAAVYTQPPRPAGRGQRLRATPVAEAAESRGLLVRTPTSLRDTTEQAAIVALDLDAAVVIAYGLILPGPVLEAPRFGCINVHASLLPRWRGAAPIQRAILEGDVETGVTIMQMEAGLDTGPMLDRAAIPIGPAATTPILHDALAALGAARIGPVLAALASGTAKALPQPEDGVVYAAKIGPEDGRILWQDAARIDRQVRALTPRPGAWFEHAGERIRLLAAEITAKAGAPGLVLDDDLTIACGAAAIRPLMLQRPGRSALPRDAFLRGFPLPSGTRLAAGVA